MLRDGPDGPTARGVTQPWQKIIMGGVRKMVQDSYSLRLLSIFELLRLKKFMKTQEPGSKQENFGFL